MDDMEEALPQVKRTKRQAPGGEEGAGGGGSGTGQNVTVDRPLGQPPHMFMKTFSRSYTCYVENGESSKHWNQNAGSTSTLPSITWCDGWAIVPWSFLPTAVTAHEWAGTICQAKRWRVLGTKVTIDSIIPFQETLVGGGTTKQAVVSFSNRPALLVYLDSGMLLPDLGTEGTMDKIEHNKYWVENRSNYTKGKLKIPRWNLHGVDTSKWDYKVSTLPDADNPQSIFSLESNGKIHTLYPGGSYTTSWKNPNKLWRSTRNHWDLHDKLKVANGADADTYARRFTQTAGSHFTSTVGQEGVINWGQNLESTRINQYADTGLEMKHVGAPYLLVKMEPYYGSDDNPMSIFAQVHIHYDIDIEWESIEGMGQLAWHMSTGDITGQSETHSVFDNKLINAMRGHPNDNRLGVAYGPAPNTSFWS